MIEVQTEGLLRMVLAMVGAREKKLEEPAVRCTAPRNSRTPSFKLWNVNRDDNGNAPTRNIPGSHCRTAKVMKNFEVKCQDVDRRHIKPHSTISRPYG